MRFVVALASVLSLAACAACSKTPPKENGATTQPKQEERIQGIPGAKAPDGVAPNFGGAPEGAGTKGGTIGGMGATLSPDEGKLSVENPGEAKAGSEVTAKIVVTPTTAYKVNTEFPTKLEIKTPEGVTVAKAEQKAGGPDKAKGDAEAFGERELAFTVKLTPAQAGNFTVNGTLKFAVCDKDTCLPKKEAVTIAFAAK
ncbi:MAG: hypothetical protein SFX73_27705 [Kofleriaceae bacterium]|nr:hypothetical protein [Kofleriaceae bacterium]